MMRAGLTSYRHIFYIVRQDQMRWDARACGVKWVYYRTHVRRRVVQSQCTVAAEPRSGRRTCSKPRCRRRSARTLARSRRRAVSGRRTRASSTSPRRRRQTARRRYATTSASPPAWRTSHDTSDPATAACQTLARLSRSGSRRSPAAEEALLNTQLTRYVLN